MEAELLKTLGQIAGIAGIALGIVLLLFRDIIGSKIFPKLRPSDAYRLLRLMVVLAWTLGIGGLALWGMSGRLAPAPPAAERIQADGGVAAGRDIQSTDIRIRGSTTPSHSPSPEPERPAEVKARGGVASGGSISGSTIVIQGGEAEKAEEAKEERW